MFSKLIGTPSTPEVPAPDRHERKCLICNHPDRDAIEDEFLHWHSPAQIASRYEVSRDAIYRHARAGNLFAERAGKMRSALDLILEGAETAKVTGDSIIRALRASYCITDDGRWVEPARNVIVTHEGKPPAAADMPIPPGAQNRAAGNPAQDEFLIATPPIRNDLKSPVSNKTCLSNRNKTRGSLKPNLIL